MLCINEKWINKTMDKQKKEMKEIKIEHNK